MDVYTELAELDMAARREVERECQWLVDASSLCADRHAQLIYGAVVKYTSSSNNFNDDSVMMMGGPTSSSPSPSSALGAAEAVELLGQVAAACDESLERWQSRHVGEADAALDGARCALFRARLMEELPAELERCQRALHDIASLVEEERALMAVAEVQRRALHRQRLHSIQHHVELEQARLKKELEETIKEAAFVKSELDAALSNAQSRGEDVFARYTKWDLLRRQLSHCRAHQSAFANAVQFVSDSVMRGDLLPESQLHVAAVYASPSSQTGGTDDASPPSTRTTQAITETASTADASGAAHKFSQGSVEWLHRVIGRWRLVVQRSGVGADDVVANDVDAPRICDADSYEERPPVTAATLSTMGHEGDPPERSVSTRSDDAHRHRHAVRTPPASRLPVTANVPKLRKASPPRQKLNPQQTVDARQRSAAPPSTPLEDMPSSRRTGFGEHPSHRDGTYDASPVRPNGALLDRFVNSIYNDPAVVRDGDVVSDPHVFNHLLPSRQTQHLQSLPRLPGLVTSPSQQPSEALKRLLDQRNAVERQLNVALHR